MTSLAVDYFFFSNGFCANQLSILVTEKNKFKIKKIILNGFKITALAEKPVKSLSLPNKRTFILNHWEKYTSPPLHAILSSWTRVLRKHLAVFTSWCFLISLSYFHVGK